MVLAGLSSDIPRIVEAHEKATRSHSRQCEDKNEVARGQPGSGLRCWVLRRRRG